MRTYVSSKTNMHILDYDGDSYVLIRLSDLTDILRNSSCKENAAIKILDDIASTVSESMYDELISFLTGDLDSIIKKESEE